MRLPLLVFHICGGLVGLLSGAVAMAFRKGSGAHAVAGKVFVVSMLSMASAGVLLAVMESQPGWNPHVLPGRNRVDDRSAQGP